MVLQDQLDHEERGRRCGNIISAPDHLGLKGWDSQKFYKGMVRVKPRPPTRWPQLMVMIALTAVL